MAHSTFTDDSILSRRSLFAARATHGKLPYNAANMNVVSKPAAAAMPMCRERITAVHRQDNPPACVLANHTRLLLSRFLAAHLAVGDEIIFPVPAANGNRAAGTESSSQSLLHRGVIATVIRRRSVTLPYPEEASGINFSCLRRFVTRASA